MKRWSLAVVFLSLAVWSATRDSWASSNPTPADESTFETSRYGFRPVSYPGPLPREEMVRILLRHAGDFHEPLTVNYREWRLAEPPDLWDLDLPHAVKIRIADDRVEVVHVPKALTLGVHETYNLPILFDRVGSEPIDVKLIGSIGDAGGPSDRFTLKEQRTFTVLNLRPEKLGEGDVSVQVFAGMRSSAAGSPPESEVVGRFEIPARTVGWGWVDVSTLDGGKPAAGRVYVTASDGLSYGPDDGSTLSRMTWTAGDPFFYSRGKHRVRLPAGKASVRVVRGFESEPVEREVTIQAGETTALQIGLKRFADMSAQGWWSGDVHIHANYNDHEIMTPSDMRVQAHGEDLHVSHLMTANSTGAHIHDEQYFEGRPHALSGPRNILYWSEEMRNAGVYGHMCLSGITSLVKPLYTGFSDTPNPYDYPPNHVQALEAKRQGGVASYAHPGYNFTEDPSTMSARELPVDAALGSVEAMDVMSNSNERGSTPYWYRLLNSGLRLSISAGTDSFTNRLHHWIPGGHRVYVYTGNSTLNYREWIDGYRAGRSFATNGPLLQLRVNGKLPGEVMDLKAGDKVRIEVSAESVVPMGRLEIVRNGEVIAVEQPSSPARTITIEHQATLDGPAWFAARVGGEFHRLLVNDTHLYAHTSPVYCRVGSRDYVNPADAQFFVGWIDRLIASVESRGKFADSAQRQEVVDLFRQGQSYYRNAAK